MCIRKQREYSVIAETPASIPTSTVKTAKSAIYNCLGIVFNYIK